MEINELITNYNGMEFLQIIIMKLLQIIMINYIQIIIMKPLQIIMINYIQIIMMKPLQIILKIASY
jgi:hypothetical protein